ncbi:MAG: patatin-like phospholipase family protein [Deltaproteobacteria bacterium]|nr:patatin-like phospholipase family protein [Deltaproteobacteria bacterium]
MSQADKSSVLLSLEQKEVVLVRALLKQPTLLDGRAEAAVRTAISLAHLQRIRVGAVDVDVEPVVQPLRDETLKLLDVAGVRPGNVPAPEKLRPVATILRDLSVRTLELLHQHGAGRIPPELIDREVRERQLVIAAGGGGGVGYVYLGAFKLLEECGLKPALIAGTSIGAILGAMRARSLRYDTGEVLNMVRGVSWGRLFHLLSMESRYGLPAALRLYLRAAFSKHFEHHDGRAYTLADLPIPLVVPVSGIRAGVLPRPLEFYEKLLDGVLALPTPFRLARKIPQIVAALIELFQISERLDPIYLGLEPGTEAFDVLDAAGFSSALPGVIHYDVVRQDERMHAVLGELFARRELFRLADGGFVDNVPARAAWRAVHEGRIGTRHAFIVALDGFAPRLSTPAWVALQQLVQVQVQKSCEWAHLYKPFTGTLSPLEVVPGIPSFIKMLERGKQALSSDLPFIQCMMQPLPPLS